MTERRSYAKGIAKRDEILTTTLAVIARIGYRHTTIQELATAVGLTPAGVLHYFGSKEELFQEVLRRHDHLDVAILALDTEDPVRSFVEMIQRNLAVPGLIQLRAYLTADAADAAHPAHPYVVERHAQLRRRLVDMIREAQTAGLLDAEHDLERIANLLLAASDGLQAQWMLDPSIDIGEHLAAVWQLIIRQG